MMVRTASVVAAFGPMGVLGAASAQDGGAAKQAAKPAPVPAGLAGEWYRGSVSLARYVDARTGAYVGHNGGGSRTWVFAKDGTYKRYVYIDTGYGGTRIFAASEGSVTFARTSDTEGTFTLRPRKGTYTYEEQGSRPMGRDALARAGTVFAYRLEAGSDGGGPYLYVRRKGEASSEADRFSLQKEEPTRP
jgi:hypothetical protein